MAAPSAPYNLVLPRLLTVIDAFATPLFEAATDPGVRHNLNLLTTEAAKAIVARFVMDS
jgi:hypothetical protein